ncbi:MAG: class I SAM-dependent methyltransferase [Dehalococcoidia bacterium]|nr:MAG: class I SAM-dependent methyltransferase [Dehalococcoidia bacterium]
MAVSTEPNAATTTTRNRYDRAARFYDLHQSMMERLLMRRLRTRLWQMAPAAGAILEIGVGTGVNIPYYPPAARATAIDLSPNMLERATRRADRLHVQADLLEMDAQHLDFADATFDAVAATCVFCSVPDPVAGLREAWRVLKPGGQLLLVEHMRSGNAVVGRVMDLLNPAFVRMSGANINRRTMDNLEAAGVAGIDASSHAFGIVKLIEARKPA